MERKTIIDTMKSMAEKANIEASREVFGYFLYGNQNYNMDEENSDINIYCLTIPSYEEIMFGYKNNKIYEKERIITKNIVGFFREIERGSFTSLELLFTPYVIINEKYFNEWEKLKNMRFALLQGNPTGTIRSILDQAKLYLHEAKEKEDRRKANGKPLANYLRLIDSAEKYCNKDFTSLYELSTVQSAVLKSVRDSSEVFKVRSYEFPRELYNIETTDTSMQIREKNKETLINLFKDILVKGNL